MDRQTLYSTIAAAKPAIATRDLIPCFVNYNFTGDHVIAYDNIKGVKLPCKTPFTGQIPGSLMLGLLSSAPAGEIKVKSSDSSVTFRVGGTTLRLPRFDSTDYLFDFPTITEDHQTVELDGSLLQAIELCLISTMPEPASPQFTGITVRHAGSSISVISSDNATLTRIQLMDRGVGAKDDSPSDYILPAEFCKLVLSLATNAQDGDMTEPPKLHFGEEFVVASFNNNSLVCTRLYAGTGDIDLAAIIEGLPSQTELTFDIPDDLSGALSRSAVITNIAGGGCKLTVTGGDLVVTTDTTIGSAEDKFAVSCGTDYEAGFYNPQQLGRLLKAATSMTLHDHCVLLSSDDESYRFDHAISRIQLSQ